MMITMTDANHYLIPPESEESVEADYGKNTGAQFHFLTNKAQIDAAYKATKDAPAKVHVALLKWASARLRRISVSTKHSELLSLATGTDHHIYLRQLMKGLLKVEHSLVLTDGLNTVQNVHSLAPSSEEKRLILFLNLIREQKLAKEFGDLGHVYDPFNIADVGTKRNLDKKVCVQTQRTGQMELYLKKLAEYGNAESAEAAAAAQKAEEAAAAARAAKKAKKTTG